MPKLKFLLVIFILIPVSLYSEVYYSISARPEIPSVGRTWQLTLLIDSDVPEEVAVISPMFTPFFRTERIVKLPRSVDAYRSEHEHEWSGNVLTFVEYTLIPEMDGLFFLGSFTIITPDSLTHTESRLINIRERIIETVRHTPRMVWEDVPLVLQAGERASFSLRATNWDTSMLEPDFFMPQVPPGLILANMPLSKEEREEGIAAKFTLIPFEDDFYLPARTLQFENTTFNIPALRIRVTTDSVLDEDHSSPEDAPAVMPVVSSKPSFPVFNISENRNEQCEEIYNTAKKFWDEGNYAASLAHLRQSEREHPAGIYLKQVRQEAEEKLGFFYTQNENRRLRIFLSGLSIFILVLVIIFPFVCYILLRKSGFSARKLILPSAVFIVLLFFFVFLRFPAFQRLFSAESFGITYETPVHSLPDINSGQLFLFKEGQPVVVMLNSGSWLFVSTNDAEERTGWIPADRLIFY